MTGVHLTMNQSISVVHFALNGYWNEIGDPRVSHLPLFSGGPGPVLVIIGLYWLSVKLCNLYMKERKPFQLRVFMVLYNLALVVVNGMGFLVSFYLTDFGLKSWFCHPLDSNDRSLKSVAIIYIGFIYFVVKFVDFSDTIIFSLRKKSNQITFLHCFHHSVMPMIAWIGLKVHPGGMCTFTPLVNSLVHTAMHFYYCLSAIGPMAVPFLWWKRYITVLQLIQFTLIFVHAVHTFFVPNCSWPTIFAVIEGSHALIFFAMFYNFYRNSYNEQKKE